MNLDWRHRLHGDPAEWLLDSDDNPSVAFWFLHDIVGRPEDASTMVELREKILFSPIVQEILAAQNELGSWDNPHLLDEPKHRSTLWALALLTELGIPRTSRRARAGCEFALENLNFADKSLIGLLAHSLLYCNLRSDPRTAQILDSLSTDAASGNIFALWALADAASEEYSATLKEGVEQLLNRLASGEFKIFGVFSSFDMGDSLLALRVLAQLNRLDDIRAREALERIWTRQIENGRWALDKSYHHPIAARAEITLMPSKWATLNVLRVVTKT